MGCPCKKNNGNGDKKITIVQPKSTPQSNPQTSPNSPLRPASTSKS